MRTTFASTLLTRAKKDPRIMLLSGDLGYSVFETYIETLPHQYLNMGVAEQNMIGVAAGLALEGRIPVVYSIIPFVTMRPFEQIRNDICCQNLNVKIVGVGAGYSYGPYGHTHHSIEDIALMRVLPRMQVLAPADSVEAHWATDIMLDTSGPFYVRLAKKGEQDLYVSDSSFVLGKAVCLKKGKDAVILATSTFVQRALDVAKNLSEKCNLGVYSVHTIKPIDESLIIRLLKTGKPIITLEEHNVIGGLGSAVAEVVVGHGGGEVLTIGVPDVFSSLPIGDSEYMRGKVGLSVPDISSRIEVFMKNNHS